MRASESKLWADVDVADKEALGEYFKWHKLMQDGASEDAQTDAYYAYGEARYKAALAWAAFYKAFPEYRV